MDALLEPCPFCGGDPQQGEFTGTYAVRCLDCGATGGDYADEKEAVGAWNRRTIATPEVEPEPDPRDREIERLRGQIAQMEKDHRDDLRTAATIERHHQEFPDEPYGTY